LAGQYAVVDGEVELVNRIAALGRSGGVEIDAGLVKHSSAPSERITGGNALAGQYAVVDGEVELVNRIAALGGSGGVKIGAGLVEHASAPSERVRRR